MGKGRPQKYNRISCQQKYILRRLIIKEKMSVKQAAQTLGINYSTAKTIMFFYRKSTTSDQLSFSPSHETNSGYSTSASYIEVAPLKKIQIFYSTGGILWTKSNEIFQESISENKMLKIENSI